MDSTVKPHVGDGSFETWFSTYQAPFSTYKQMMRDAYAAGMSDQAALDAAVSAERERCAKVCEEIAQQYLPNSNRGHAAERAANAIRKG